jgi:hypothetical protein
MAHHYWFDQEDMVVTASNYALTIPVDSVNQRQFMRKIKNEYELSGRTEALVKSGKNRWKTWVAKPGVVNELIFDTRKDSLFVTTRTRQDFSNIANRMHHITGFHGGVLYIVWGIFVDLTILGFFAFAVTGLLIWIKMRKLFKWGWYIIIPVSVFFIAITIYLIIW